MLWLITQIIYLSDIKKLQSVKSSSRTFFVMIGIAVDIESIKMCLKNVSVSCINIQNKLPFVFRVYIIKKQKSLAMNFMNKLFFPIFRTV